MPAGVAQARERRVAGGDHRVEQQHRHDRQPVAELGRLGEADLGRLAGDDHVEQARAIDALRHRRTFLEGLRRLDEGHVGAGREGAVDALDRLLEAEHRHGVGAGDQHDVGVGPVLGRGAHLADEVVGVDDLLAVEVTAALGRDLVLDVQRGRAAQRVLAHGPHDVELVAVARVGVGDHGDRDRGGEAAEVLGHLGHGQQPVVGVAEGGRRAGARHVHSREARLLDQAGGQRVVGAGRHDQLVARQELAQPRAGRHETAAPRAASPASATSWSSL